VGSEVVVVGIQDATISAPKALAVTTLEMAVSCGWWLVVSHLSPSLRHARFHRHAITSRVACNFASDPGTTYRRTRQV
jgi:hypothetical protein